MKRATSNRKASAQEVLRHGDALRALSAELGLGPIGVRDDGTVVVHADEPGYRQAMDMSQRASELVGTYVHVITDDVPGAVSAQAL